MSQIVTKFIAPNAIDNTRLAQAPANTLKGNNTGSTANELDLSVANVQAMLSVPTSGSPLSLAAGGTGTSAGSANAAFNALAPLTTAGDIIYENATPAAAALAIGTTGQVLTVVSGLPAWATPAASGANTALSNLIATAINQNLLPDTNTLRTLGGPNFVWSSVYTANVVNSNGGDSLSLSTANNNGSGGIALTTGNGSGGASGGITLTTGTNTTRGQIQFQDGSQGTAGYVWTSTDTVGSGHWAVAATTGITALTGDVTASGSGSVVATLAATSNGTLTTLSALTTASSLATVGTITSGTWNGTAVGAVYGGTGQTSYAVGDTLYASSSTALSKLAIGSTGNVLTVVGGVPAWTAPATSGSVTSVAFADASTTPIYSISGSPVTSSGTLTQTLTIQSANTVFAGPTTGSAQPTFRALVAADIPSLSATYVTQSEVGVASGVASLDGGGKVPLSQLPSALMEFQGNWDPTTNTPALVDGTGTTGFTYWVSAAAPGPVAGLSDPSMVNFQVGDLVIYNGTAWVLTTPAAGVSAVNGAQGAVTMSMASANGFAGTYSGTALTVSTTITGLLKGNGTAISAATAGTDYVIPSGSITGTAGNITATTNSTLTTLSSLSLLYSQLTGTPAIATNNKETFVLSGTDITNQYVTLAHTPIANSTSFLVSGAGDQLEGTSYDYVVSGATIVFQNGLATGGVSALVSGDIIQIQYEY